MKVGDGIDDRPPGETLVRGCVYAAARVVYLGLDSNGDLATRGDVEAPADLYDAIEATFQRHHRELIALTGTDAIWRRLAELHERDAGTFGSQPALFE